ncbi:hypothetical protein DNK47_02760 [Mycoplasma wenyonii]|uniref:Uncharacterized protein n=1 Tax=Mycoplasma wenyonii TaxID=65123 RepID=A0A328PK60_9MOLU|nr:hypothetical protein [Mycoplasma wenyonii]RAO94864.1 hypothetical protein DNK47_02760 [Mycoplasma wenyonii]
MFGLMKVVLAVALGVGGVGAVVYGVTSTKSSSNYWDSWQKTLEGVGSPILLCDEKADKYEGIMKVSEDGKNDMGLGLTVDFKATQWDYGVARTGEGESWTRKWGDRATGGNDWESWEIYFDKGKVDDLRYRDFGTRVEGYTVDNKVGSCGASKIKLKESISKNIGEKGINSKDIRFTTDKNNCQIETGSVACDIVFTSESNLEWVNGFKPKIKYVKPSK